MRKIIYALFILQCMHASNICIFVDHAMNAPRNNNPIIFELEKAINSSKNNGVYMTHA